MQKLCGQLYNNPSLFKRGKNKDFLFRADLAVHNVMGGKVSPGEWAQTHTSLTQCRHTRTSPACGTMVICTSGTRQKSCCLTRSPGQFRKELSRLQKRNIYFIKEWLQSFNLASDTIWIRQHYAAISALAGASFTDLRGLQRRLSSLGKCQLLQAAFAGRIVLHFLQFL